MNQTNFASLYAASESRILKELTQYLSFQSISTDPAYDADCRRCAEWLCAEVQKFGFTSRLVETGTKPVLLASRAGKIGKPKVLIYGHYDVQPVDPVSAWQSPPFEAVQRDGRIWARGATDNKGPTFSLLKALEALHQAGHFDVPVTLLIEGEEESGSAGLYKVLPDLAKELEADILLVSDTTTAKQGVPGITMSLRALIGLEVTVKGLSKDLHSGIHGGAVANPATELCRLISSLHNGDGSIAVDGYYEGVKPPSAEELKRIEANPLSLAEYQKQVGVLPLGGETGFSAFVRRGCRPCIDINGFHSGYGGPGGKTIIPAFATAKITSRLVDGQNPLKCLESLVAHLKAQPLRGLELDIQASPPQTHALRVDLSEAHVQRAIAAIKETAGAEPVLLWEGASIPVLGALVKISKAKPLLVGLIQEDDNMHAPDESFSVAHIRQGFLFACQFLGSL
jgi:acetylornithine deacetylase/succinyl-diaminopimelate desuccinylase-like protein